MNERNEKMEMGCQCRLCGKVVYLEATVTQWEEYHNPHRRHIQAIFPEMSASNRELLISGICGECFDSLFGQEDDEF